MQPMKSKHTEAGFTLLELLLVVGVGALLLIGGIATYRLVSEGNKVTDTARLIMTVRNEAQTLAQGQGYDQVEVALEDAKIIVSGQKNVFGGDFKVTGSTAELSVEVDGIPGNPCRKLAMAIKDQGVELNGAEPPKTISDVGGLCGTANNRLTWTFP